MEKTTPAIYEGIIKVCMCCYPGETIYERFPEWKGLGLTISHGVCIPCKERLLAEFNKKCLVKVTDIPKE